jgi:hypothetical protein
LETSGQETTEETKENTEELDQYSKGVQKRIRQLNERYRQEQADKEEAARIARKLAEENQRLQQRVQQLDTGYLNEYGSRVQTASAAAEQAYLAAAEEGDTQAMLDAQKALAKAQYDQGRFETAKQQADYQAAQQKAVQQQPAQQQPVQQQPAQQQPRPDPRAEKWASDNKWFGDDVVMTVGAQAIHKTMIEQEGFDPHNEEYYTELDKRVRSYFPSKFEQLKPRASSQVASATASASRNPNQKRTRTVPLTPSELDMARRLNVPPEIYAKYKKD